MHLRNLTRESWRDIDTELQRRYDLIPNLVNTVKGYAAHEQQTFDAVTAQRADAMAATREPDEQAPREQALGRGVAQLLAVAERYPDLKASEQFLALQRQLADTEDRIQVARRIYNANVRAYDTLVQTFPAVARRPDVRVHDAAVLRARPDRPRARARRPWTCQVGRRQVQYKSCATSTSPTPCGPASRPATWAPGAPWPASSSWPGSTAPAGSPCAGRSTCCARRASSRAAGARAGSRRSTRSASRSVGSPPSRPRSRRPGARPGREILAFGFVDAPAAVADALHVDRGADVLRVERVNLADDEPFALVTVWVRADVGADVSRADVERRHVLRPAAAARRRARLRAPDDHRRARERGAARGCSRARPARRCCSAGASRSTRPASPTLVSEHRYPADRTTFEIEFSLRAGALQHA